MTSGASGSVDGWKRCTSAVAEMKAFSKFQVPTGSAC